MIIKILGDKRKHTRLSFSHDVLYTAFIVEKYG